MDMTEINKHTTAELSKLLAEKKESLRAWRFGLVGSKSKNMKEGMATRKDIARILTAINHKIRGAEHAAKK